MQEYELKTEESDLELSDQQWESHLKQILYRASCPSDQDLGEFQLGILEQAATSQVSLHLESCPHCRQELNQLDDFLGSTEPVRSLASEPFNISNWIQSKAQVLIAQVIPDFSIGLDAVTRPVRNLDQATAMKTEAKSVMYIVNEISGSLEIQPDADSPEERTVEVVMAVPETDAWSAEAWLLDGDEPMRIENKNHNLKLSRLTSGCYTFVLMDGLREIYIENIEIS